MGNEIRAWRCFSTSNAFDRDTRHWNAGFVHLPLSPVSIITWVPCSVYTPPSFTCTKLAPFDSRRLHVPARRVSCIDLSCFGEETPAASTPPPPSEKKLSLVVSWVVDVDKEGSLREPQREGWPLHRGLGMPGASDGHVRAMQAHCRSSWTEAASQLPGGATWRSQGTTCRRGWP